MVELAVWYDQDAGDDFREGDGEIIIRTQEELDALVDRVLRETVDHRCPAAIQVSINGRKGLPVLEVGLGQERGFIQYHAEDGGSTKGNGSPEEYVEYVYMGNLSEVQADVEVDITQVRQGLIEFLETGRRPSVVRD
ncbi:Imm1 family immunity protein [Actinokineospora sp. 24-640]